MRYRVIQKENGFYIERERLIIIHDGFGYAFASYAEWNLMDGVFKTKEKAIKRLHEYQKFSKEGKVVYESK